MIMTKIVGLKEWLKEAFRALTNDDIVQPDISDHDFRSSKIRSDDVSYSIYVFERRQQLIVTVSPAI